MKGMLFVALLFGSLGSAQACDYTVDALKLDGVKWVQDDNSKTFRILSSDDAKKLVDDVNSAAGDAKFIDADAVFVLLDPGAAGVGIGFAKDGCVFTAVRISYDSYLSTVGRLGIAPK
jgi:hypothetical protein